MIDTRYELISETVIDNTIVDDIFDEILMHIRIEEHSRIDVLLRGYVEGAIAAVENYLQKDVLPRSYELSWTCGNVLRLTKGAIRNLSFASAGSPAEDLSASMKFSGSRTFRGAGLRITGVSATSDSPISVTFDTGFLKAVLIPAEIRSYINVFTGMQDQVRELANTGGTGRYTIDEYPAHLLDPLKTEVFA